MARLWQSGFELNSLTAAVEWTTTGVTVPTIVTSPVRTGTYAGRISGLVSGAVQMFLYQFAAANGAGPYFARAYFNFTTFPAAENCIMGFRAFANVGSPNARISIDNSGILRLKNGTTQIGSNSSALSTGQWYCIELKHDSTGGNLASTLEARLDQLVFATASNLTLASPTVESLLVGGNALGEGNSTGDWAIDDIAINDSTGSNQTSYPGAGGIVHLRPNATGDSAGWTLGGTSTSDWQGISEVTPDDATTYIFTGTLNTAFLVNCDDAPSSIGSSDTINVVAVGVRFTCSSATSPPAFTISIESQASGTLASASAITPNATSFKTNANAAPDNYPLVTYTEPQAGGAWTKTLLGTAQIGANLSSQPGSKNDRISTMWISVDFTPSTTIFIPSLPIIVKQAINRASTY